MFNQPPIIGVVFGLLAFSILVLTGISIYEDIQNSQNRKLLEKLVDTKCPQCGNKLKIESATKDEYCNIEYYTYCSNCKTTFRPNHKSF